MTVKTFPSLRPGELHEDVIVCGDPGRVLTISEYLDDSVEVAYSREYRAVNGVYKGKKISVVSHGVGASGAAVCFEKLSQLGVKRIIRVGTAGSYSEENPPGTILIADSAAREEGVTHQLVPSGMPAIANFEILSALKQAVEKTDFQYNIGTIVTLDAFFTGVLSFPHKEYKLSGALGAEMELAALYIVARMRNIKAGGVVALDGYADKDLVGYNPDKEFVHRAVEAAITIALDAFVEL